MEADAELDCLRMRAFEPDDSGMAGIEPCFLSVAGGDTGPRLLSVDGASELADGEERFL